MAKKSSYKSGAKAGLRLFKNLKDQMVWLAGFSRSANQWALGLVYPVLPAPIIARIFTGAVVGLMCWFLLGSLLIFWAVMKTIFHF